MFFWNFQSFILKVWAAFKATVKSSRNQTPVAALYPHYCVKQTVGFCREWISWLHVSTYLQSSWHRDGAHQSPAREVPRCKNLCVTPRGRVRDGVLMWILPALTLLVPSLQPEETLDSRCTCPRYKTHTCTTKPVCCLATVLLNEQRR